MAAVVLPRCVRAAPSWVDRRAYGPFQVASTFALGSWETAFSDLGRLQQELYRTLRVPPPRAPIEVYLLDSEESHRAFLTGLFPRVPYRRALYVQRSGAGAVYAYRHAELAIDLRHECTHALLHADLAMLPLWLDEGLAEYFEMPEYRRAFDHPHLSALKWSLRLGMHRTIESLEEDQELADMDGVDYRFAWAWVHFMLHGPIAAHRTLVQFLTDIRRGEPPGRLSVRLRAAFTDLDARMGSHFRQWRRVSQG